MNDDNLASNERKISFSYKDKSYSFYTDNGVFSKDKLDYGTRLLLENLPVLKGSVLDLGWGIGVVGIILKVLNMNISIDMVDINERAINLSIKNAKLNRVDNRIFVSDIYNSINSKYDYIITNPPIRAGKEVIRKFLIGSYDYLNDKGELWFVMRKDHGVKSMMKEMENLFSLEVVERDKGFYVIRAIKNK